MMRTLPSILIIVLVAAAGLLLEAPRETEARSNILWRDCFGFYQCGAMRVPLDHSRPAEGDIELALIRVPAFDQENRIGSLLVNFGGPGGPGVSTVAEAVDFIFPFAIRERFDIIGFDPRGVGQSTAIDCVDSFGFLEDVDHSPDMPSEVRHAVDAARQFGKDCQRRSRALIQHVNTEAAARDMDLIREELGDEKLTYLGFSYGTFLGATYAEFFPERVRALVLDGGLDPALPPDQDVIQQSLGFERALDAFFTDCASDPNCPFKARDLEVAYDQLLAETDERPLQGWDFPITKDAIIGATAGALYDRESGWLVLAEALRQAVDEHSGVGFGVLLTGIESDEELVDPTNLQEAFSAVACVDFWDFGGDEALWERTLEEASGAAPHFGSAIAHDALPCVFWPGAERRTPRTYTAAGAAPILVVGTRRDPATPYQWSQGLSSGLESGMLLSYDGDGHTAFGKNACVDGYVEAYLIDLTVPPPGTECANDYGLFDDFLDDLFPPDGPLGDTPPVPAPEGAPTGAILPPDTGGGPSDGPGGILPGILSIALLAAGGALLLEGRRTRRQP